MHDIVTFLRGFAPFDTADESELDELASSVSIEFFGESTLLLEATGAPADSAYMIRSGQVELLDHDRVVDVLGPGDLVGVPSVVGDMPPGLSSRAGEDTLAYRIPAKVLLPFLSDRSGLGYVARLVQDRALEAKPASTGADNTAASVSTCTRPAVIVEPGTPISEVIARMQHERTSSALVTAPDGTWGIVTDRDMRDRVLATGLPVSAPIADAATFPARTVDPMLPVGQAILEMLSRGIHHLPVVSPDGAVLGMVEDIDLLNAQSHTPLALRRAIAHAEDPESLAVLSVQVRTAALTAQRSGRAAPEVTALISLLADAITQRAIAVHTEKHGPAPVPFAWVCTGSVARGEAVLSSDVDNLIIWDGDDKDPAIRGWMRGFASDVIDTLQRCGLAVDTNGVRADDPRFSRSLDAWLQAVRTWGADPTQQQGDVYLSTLTDARAVTGEALTRQLHNPVIDVLQTPLVRNTLQRVACSHRPPTGFIREFVIDSSGKHSGTLDIKRGGTEIITAIARTMVATTGTHSLGTRERLWLAADHGHMKQNDAEDLVDAFEFLQTLRLEHQLEQLNNNQAPDDLLSPAELSGLNRRHLRNAFRVIARVQGRLPAIVRNPPA